MIFENKESIVEDLFNKQFEILKKITIEFKRFISDYLNTPKEIEEKNYNINHLEHEGDKIRRNIETDIEQGAFIPLYRGDYIMFAEIMDSIFNRIESTYMEIILTKPVFPAEIHKKILELTEVSLEACIPLTEIFPQIGEPIENTRYLFEKIEKKEHDADIIETELIRTIFTLDTEYAHKLHLKNIVERLASFADLAENTGDRLQIMVVKRTI